MTKTVATGLLPLLKTVVPWIPAALLAVAVLAKARDVSDTLYQTDNHRIIGPKLSSLDKGALFSFKRGGQVYQVIGFHPFVESILSPASSPLTLFKDQHNSILFTSSKVKVYRRKAWD